MAKEPEDRDFMEVPEDESDPLEWDDEAQAPEKLSVMEAEYRETDDERKIRRLQSFKTTALICIVLLVAILIWSLQPRDHSMDRQAQETKAEYQARIDRAHEEEPEQDLSGGSHGWE